METTTAIQAKVTPKDFFLWLGAMVAFYWSVVAFIFLTFDYINYTFPNPLAYYPSNPYESGISYEMASLIVLLPIYLLLVWLIRKDVVRDSSRKEIWVRRWALILTLFVAAITVAGDFITLLTTFFNGEELTTAFLLKIAIVFLVAAAVFMHFIADLKGYWGMFPKRRRSVGIAVAILAILTIVAGFFIVGTPAHARLARFDAQKVNDLQNIQGQINSYFQVAHKLPKVLTDLNSSLSYGPVPVDSQTGESYIYQTPGDGISITPSFKLCAVFNVESRTSQNQYSESRAVAPTPVGGKGMMAQDTWEHGTGQVCFNRSIDMQFLPPGYPI